MVAALVAAALPTLAACTSPYEATHACSIPADTVAELVGTERFTANHERVDGLPFATTSTAERGSTACRVDARETSLVVRAMIVPDSEAQRRTEQLESYEGSYALGGGPAWVEVPDAGWACGSVVVMVNVEGEDRYEASESALREALETLAREATCFDARRPPGRR